MPKLTGLNTALTSTDPTTSNNINTLAGLGNSNLPIGAIVPFVGSSAPTGMLICDGSAISRTTYPDLFVVMGTAFGSGDGSTTFNLPNFKTGHKIPIGKDSSNASIQSIGLSGGSFDHTHTSTAHAHSFTHSHTMGNHTHAYDHSHTMGNHTHSTDHTHSQSAHVHSIPAHGHSSFAITSFTGDSHTHSFSLKNGGTNDLPPPRPADTNNGALTFNSTTDTQTLSVTATVGYASGTDMTTTAVNSGAPSDDTTGNPSATTTSSISTNSTSSATGSTNSISTNSTASYSGNTDSGGGSLTTTVANPPFLTVNFIIKAL